MPTGFGEPQPSFPVAFALQRHLAIVLPILPLAFRAMPQDADESSTVDAMLLFHSSATEKAVNRVRFS